jgi:hypothetical protein
MVDSKPSGNAKYLGNAQLSAVSCPKITHSIPRRPTKRSDSGNGWMLWPHLHCVAQVGILAEELFARRAVDFDIDGIFVDSRRLIEFEALAHDARNTLLAACTGALPPAATINFT